MTRSEERAFAYQRELGMHDSVSDEHIVARRMGFYDGYCQAEKDLNKKPSEDLEEAAGLYLDSHKPLTRYNWGDLQDAFKAGAEWQRKQDAARRK